MKRYNLRVWLILAVSALTMSAFQNCEHALNFGGGNREATHNSSGGDSYSGKPGYYLEFDRQAPCSQISNLGNPFPNRQIFVTGGIASLVRDNCADITPVILAPADYVINADNTLTYQGQTFDLYPNLREFDQIPRTCPSGAPPAAFNPAASLFPDPLLLPAWLISTGVEVPLYGSVQALPRFQIRHTVNNFDYRRVTSRMVFRPDTDYAFSVWMAAGNQPEAIIYFWVDDNNDWGWSFDLVNGTHGFVHSSNFPGANLRATMEPHAGGYVATVFFRTPANLPNSPGDLGPGPRGSTAPATLMEIPAGAFIHATGADLREVSSYCP